MIRHVFPAMGTEFEMLLEAPDSPEARGALEEAALVVHRLEGLLSRFLPDSELSELNRAGGGTAGPEMLAVLGRALAARRMTAGRFDPTLGGAVRAAGYDRPLGEGLDREQQADPAPPGLRTVAIGPDGAVRLGAGAELDLGGIAKGWTVERAADALGTTGPCLVSGGGDIAVRGVPAGAGTWAVGIPAGGAPLTLGIAGRGLATSGTARRRWRRGGEEMHHVIDPATRRPARTDLVQVTVVARDAVDAEVWATALLVAGAEQARAECARHGLAAVLVRPGGDVEVLGVAP